MGTGGPYRWNQPRLDGEDGNEASGRTAYRLLHLRRLGWSGLLEAGQPVLHSLVACLGGQRRSGRSSDDSHRDAGRGLYFEDPDGHLLEIITRPYGSGS